MSLATVPAAELLPRLAQFDTLIDARSEAEFAHDHLPLAVNWPTLDDAQRQHIGTLYVQVSAFEAKKQGAVLAARNIAAHIERQVLDKPKDWQPLLYCWRGGKRSGALGLVLDQIGFRVTLIAGGYKAFRAAMLLDLAARVQALRWQVLCGTTGSGKTRLLHALARQGAQILDLEALAQHRSSVLGAIPGQEQPTQKRFDTLIWDALRHLDPSRPVFVESESKKVGNVSLPTPLVERMRASPCLHLHLPLPERVALLLEDYPHFVQNPDLLRQRLDILVPLRGKAVVQDWQALLARGDVAAVVQELLLQHYDPGYVQSMQRNFAGYAQAQSLSAPERSATAFDALALEVLAIDY